RHHVVRVSAGPGGVPADYASGAPAVSGDGRRVAYQTGADDLGDVDANLPPVATAPGARANGYDVYVYDVVTAASTLASRSSAGAQGDADAYWPVLSRDGSVLVFASIATNLVAGDTNAQPDVFARTGG